MKLDYKRTTLIGFAFLSICAFWQMYDNLIPLILTNTFHMDETLSGAIMAADNVLALFLLPLFGGISDRCKHRMGRRSPFIVVGTVAAVILMTALPALADSYNANPTAGKMYLFIAVLGGLLIAMGTYRSPAVALMPDVTPKPLRSRANAVINLMGAVGGIIYLLITTFLYKTKSEDYVSYFPLFSIIGGIMLVALVVIVLLVDEQGLSAAQKKYEEEHPEENLAEETAEGEALPAEVKRSLWFLLASIALWYISYNGVTTWFSVYAQNTWGMSLGQANTCLTIATGGAIVSYIPVGQVASRVGRRKTIRIGTLLLTVSFGAAFLYTLLAGSFSPVLYVLFVMVGMGWAAINVNSLPMVVEMCRASDVGRFTGMYYTFSMAAQIVTPIVAGWLLGNIDYKCLFPYAAFFAFASFITMGCVRHGDNKVEAKRGLEAFDVED